MAYEIGDFDGTKAGVSGDYPFNQVKNAPSGTRVNRKMVTDLLQTSQKVMNDTGVVPNNDEDNVTNGYQVLEGFEKMMGRYGGAAIESLMGGTYVNGTVYIISGVVDDIGAGLAYYNHEVFYVAALVGPACVGPNEPVLNILNNATTDGGMRVMQITCGLAGSGITNYPVADAVRINKWVDMSTPTIALSGGGTVTVGSWAYKRYLLRGRTVTLTLTLRNVVISTSGGGTLDINMSFLGTNTVVNNNGIYGIVVNDGTGPGFGVATLVNGSPAKIKLTYGTWPDDTYTTIDVSVTFEIQ